MTGLIVGLGNPGKKYASTRHNVGWLVIDALAKQLKIKFKKMPRLQAEIALGEGIILAKPLTFMNNSGRAVAGLIKRFGIPTEGVAVVYDDLDLPVGKIRERKGGSSGGHRGMQSIIDALKTTSIARVRIGISRGAGDPSEFVLQPLTRTELAQIKPAIAEVVAALLKTHK